MLKKQKYTNNNKAKPRQMDNASSDIAVIGMACRFPNANDYNEFWDNLTNGVNSIREVSKERWDISSFYSPNISEPNKSYCKWCGCIDQIEYFDNNFFNISPREALVIDPQQRQMMEVAWQSIEDAGVPLSKLQKMKTSFHVAISQNDYGQRAFSTENDIDSYTNLGNYPTIAANRVSFSLGLTGTSIAIDAACASGGVVIHEAKRVLLTGESDYALAGSVNLVLHQGRYISFSKARMLSADGQCHTYDEGANGFVPGEGVGVVLLQRLEDAIRENNHIYAVIKGSGVNHIGHATSITAPKVEAQAELILSAYKEAGFSPETLGYMEAHGTGTSLGDPVEVTALTKAFRKYTDKKQYCKIGSVKTNIGHLEGAAGMASFIKTVLMIQNHQIPKTLNIKRLNPIINFEKSPFSVADELTDWKPVKKGVPLRAGVSALGFGGVNSHILLEEYFRKKIQQSEMTNPTLFLLSAKNPKSLAMLVERWKLFVNTEKFKQMNLDDICGTTMLSRSAFQYRYGCKVTSKEDIKAKLNETFTEFTKSDHESWELVVGDSLLHGYCDFKEIYATHAIFKEHIDQFKGYLSTEFWNGLFADQWEEPKKKLYSFVVFYSFIAALIDLGLKFNLLIYEGMGFWVALATSQILKIEEVIGYLSGKVSFDNLKFARPTLNLYDNVTKQQILPYNIDRSFMKNFIEGAQVDSDDFILYLKKSQTLYTRLFTFKKFVEEWNTPLKQIGKNIKDMLFEDIVIDGKYQFSNERLLLMIIMMSSLQRVHQKWDLEGDRLNYSRQFQEILDLVLDNVINKENIVQLLGSEQPDFAALADEINPRLGNMSVDKPYELIKEANSRLTEINDYKKWVKFAETSVTPYHPEEKKMSLQVGECKGLDINKRKLVVSDNNMAKMFTDCVFEAWLKGTDIIWEKFCPEESIHKVPLPVYEFDRKPFLLPLPGAKTGVSDEQSAIQQCFQIKDTIIRDHVITGKNLVPGASMLQFAFAAIKESGKEAVNTIKDVVISSPGIVKDQKTIEFREVEGNGFELIADTQVLCKGKYEGKDDLVLSPVNLRGIDTYPSVPLKDLYRFLFDMGYQYGQTLQVINDIKKINEGYIVRVSEKYTNTQNQLSAEMLDGIMQSVLAVEYLEGNLKQENSLYIPYSIKKMSIMNELKGACYVAIHKNNLQRKGKNILAQLSVFNSEGEPVLAIKDLHLQLCPDNFLQETTPKDNETESPETKGNSLSYYRPAWVERTIESAAQSKTEKSAIIFMNNAIGVQLSDIIKSRYAQVYYVEKGNGFSNRGNTYTINHLSEEDYFSLINSIDSQTGNNVSDCDLYYLWSYEAQPAELNSTFDFEHKEENDIRSIFNLFKSLLVSKSSCKENVIVTISCSYTVDSKDTGHGFMYGGIAAFAKTVMQENPKVNITVVDLPVNGPDDSEKAHILFNEGSKQSQGEIVAYRNNKRFIRAIEPVNDIDTNQDQILKDGHVYIIIGGMGGIGIHVAEKISRTVKANLILIGSSELNDTKKSQLEKLNRYKSKAEYFQCNIACEEELKSLFDTVKSLYKNIHGVIQCSGINRDKLLISKDWNTFKQVLAPKTKGTYIINKLTESEPLEFFACFSSIVSITGNIGQSDYAAANGFIDTFLDYRRQTRYPGKDICINWTLWENVGMGQNNVAISNFSNKTGLISKEMGVEAFIKILQGSHNQVIVISDENSFVNFLTKKNIPLEVRKTLATAANTEKITDQNETGIVLLEKVLSTMLAGLLGIDEREVDENTDLRELGLDFVSMNEFSEIINQKLGTDINSALLFEYSNMREIADYLRNEYSTQTKQVASKPNMACVTGKVNATTTIKHYSEETNGAGLGNILSTMLAQLLGVEEDEIDENTDLRELGLDSVSMNEFSEKINQKLGTDINSTLLFEYSNMKEIGNYLMQEYSDQLQRIIGNQSKVSTVEKVNPITAVKPQSEEVSGAGLEKILTTMLAQLLGVEEDEIDENTDLRELGLDSVSMNEFSEKINKKLGTDINSTLLFEYSNMKEIGNYLMQEYSDQLQRIIGNQSKVSTVGKVNPITAVKPQSEEVSGAGLEKILTTMLAQLLGVEEDEIDENTDLRELGLDSVSMNEFSEKINQKLGTDINSTLLFEYSNMKEIGDYLRKECSEQIQQLIKPVAKIEQPSISDLFAQTEFVETKLPKLFEDEPLRNEDIAIIGISGRMPQSENLNEFWEHLVGQEDFITEIPRDRWNWEDYYGDPKSEENKANNKWGGFLKDIRGFDASFFNLSPREAELMDPQQRILLEEVWRVFEDAGYKPSSLSGSKTGIFIGAGNDDYRELIGRSSVNMDSYAATGSYFSIVANRISYLLDIHGPSTIVDTACSSSLVAVHQAVQAIRNNECTMAVAGGVNIICIPRPYLSFSHAGMLSKDGRCKTFDASANGYVRAEGVGVALLKPHSKAIEDGDQIYGVIKGTAINHNGSTNSLTAPNPNAQAEVIMSAFEKGNIDPSTVTYMEAHGTGTSLGDPIEVNGLKKAFKEMAKKYNIKLEEKYCGLGAVKTNIGHLEIAAGIAGVFKILLSMKHKIIPGNLHFNQLNPYIQIQGSPFYIVNSNKPWETLKDKYGNSIPRRAGVSSFGFGGANAHIIIEEYVPKANKANTDHLPSQSQAIIVLSAKNEERLKAYAQQLVSFLEKENYKDEQLTNIAYTLQMGREAMEERLAVIADSISDLKDKLKNFVEGQKGSKDIFFGKVNNFKETMAIFEADQEFGEAVNKWLTNKKYNKIVELWVKGLSIDWNKLYGDIKPQCISLPTYPFAKDQYWIPESAIRMDNKDNTLKTSAIHPLLHQNTSDLMEQRYSSTFTGVEFFLADHVIQGKKILPGVAYLEMVRAAIIQATGTKENESLIRIRKMAWSRPVIVNGQSVQVHIGLYPENNDEIAFEIYSVSETDHDDQIVHGQGVASVTLLREAPVLDLASIKAKCENSILLADECYKIYESMGLHYGKGHQGIERIHLGDGQVLAKLSMPASVLSGKDQFYMHPSLMDSALQASIGLMIGKNGEAPNKPLLPFALEELDAYGACTTSMWARIKPSGDISVEQLVNAKVQRMDIDLCDEQGMVKVHMKGYSARTLSEEIGRIGSTTDEILLQPCWKEYSGKGAFEKKPLYGRHLVIFCGLAPEISKQVSVKGIQSSAAKVEYITLQTARERIDERFTDYTIGAFEKIQGILKEKIKEKALVQIVVPSEGEKNLYSGLYGLLKTARQENSRLVGQMIEIEPGEKPVGVINELEENTHYPTETHIRYYNGKRMISGWNEITVTTTDVGQTKTPWKEGGIYLITGGAGGLGLIFAEEIIEKAKSVTLILTGRSSLDKVRKGKLAELQTSGVHIKYKQVDVSHKAEVTELIKDIQNEYGELNGIIHCAGVIRDNYILKKTEKELRDVLAPKVAGLVNLDEASQNLDLDIFINFSSIVGSLGNPGQADYAAANAFMDVYSKYRNVLVSLKQRHGKTLSINWPLWRKGGMQIDAETEGILEQSTGLIAMQTHNGIKAFYEAFASGLDQVMVAAGNRERILYLVGLNSEQEEPVKDDVENNESPVMEKAMTSQEELREKASNYFKVLLSSELRLPVHRIEEDAPMEKYGIDSVMVMQMTNKLEKVFGTLSKTLFFEYQTIRELTGYFLDSYSDQLNQLLGISESETAVTAEESAPVTINPVNPVTSVNPRRKRFASFREQSKGSQNEAMDIAIIGLSGKYPQARSIAEYWDNLKNGKDCITEIPKDRWDHSLYFDEDKSKSGKTYSKWGGFVDGVYDFDPLFFNISPREAELIDPQERLFLQCAYETLEDAGYTRETCSRYKGFGLEGNIGVFVGAMYEEYQLYGAQAQAHGKMIALNANPASIANRVSYFFNFHGPSMTIDTMCSSSLTAIHLACQSLQHVGCEMAIAGGVNVSVHPNKYLMLSQGKFISSKGLCESFGEGGDGYVPGEGVGALLLKPLSKAVADGDHIYGVIKGTAINHGGKTNGFTVPNPNAQAEVIRRVYQESGVNPRTVSYIEAHGTGTSLGDPIEIAGLSKTFREYTHDKQFCKIGSAKSNIGHCESAAGIAGVTKVLLQMKYSQLVPSLHSKILNPNIDFTDTPFIVQQELTEWERPVIELDGVAKEYPRLAGISAFGAGGSNAHILIEEYIPKQDAVSHKAHHAQNSPIIVLSAKNESQLQEKVGRLITTIREQPLTDAELRDVAYTLQIGREAMEKRLALVVNSIKELAEKLQRYLDEGAAEINEIYMGQVKQEKETLSVFADDEDLQKAVDSWIVKGKYGKLLDLWAKGLIFDWSKLYSEADGIPQRISLPTYPFAKEHYQMVDDSPKMSTVSVNNMNNRGRYVADFDERYYEQLIDEVMNDTISIDNATRKIYSKK